MNKKKTLPELYAIRDRYNEFIGKIAKSQRALENITKADEKMMDAYTRLGRTHRLCTRAGMLESFLREPVALSNGQVIALLRIAFEQDLVKKELKKMLQEAYSGKSPGTIEA